IHGALGLLATIVAIGGLFLLLGSEFLAAMRSRGDDWASYANLGTYYMERRDFAAVCFHRRLAEVAFQRGEDVGLARHDGGTEPAQRGETGVDAQ
ncbi:MAG: NADH-quinone oxidoreductase subunit J, partial [Acidobacteriota bacterium]